MIANSEPRSGLDSISELKSQRLRFSLNAIETELSCAIQYIKSAKKQIPNFVDGKVTDALSEALQKQETNLYDSMSTINTLMKGV
jgi:hypothetical protein